MILRDELLVACTGASFAVFLLILSRRKDVKVLKKRRRKDRFSSIRARKGIPALQNLGNTCFLNALMQALASLSFLVDFLHGILSNPRLGRKDLTEKAPLTVAFYSLLQDLQKYETTSILLDPTYFQGQLDAKVSLLCFSDGGEHDAHELFLLLFQVVEEEFASLNVDKGKVGINILNGTGCSQVPKLEKGVLPFSGLVVSMLSRCDNCGFQAPYRTESFVDLSLTLFPALSQRPTISLFDCLRQYTSLEMIESVCCSECKEIQNKAKRLLLARLPKIFIFRFHRVHPHSGSRKDETVVDFPLYFDAEPFCVDEYCPPCSGKYYKLASVILHIGNAAEGHFVSYRRVNKEWFHANDENTMQVSEERVLHSRNTGKNVYMLFYEKIK
eukprot:g79.t1